MITAPTSPSDRVHPHPAEEAAGQQGGDGQHRREGVGQDVGVGGTQVVIVAMMMAVRVRAIVGFGMVVHRVSRNSHAWRG